MARRVIRHLSEPEIRRSMAEELIAQTFINKSDDYAEFRAAKAEEPRRPLHGELGMTTDDAERAADEACPSHRRWAALPCRAGTFEGTTVLVTGGGTGLGSAIATEFARLGASIVIASRKPEHLDEGKARLSELGVPVLTVGCDIRDADQIAAAFDIATAELGLPGVLVNNAAANFPVPAEDMSPERVAHGRRHHAERHLLLRT